jgi:hypothetical protein
MKKVNELLMNTINVLKEDLSEIVEKNELDEAGYIESLPRAKKVRLLKRILEVSQVEIRRKGVTEKYIPFLLSAIELMKALEDHYTALTIKVRKDLPEWIGNLQDKSEAEQAIIQKQSRVARIADNNAKMYARFRKKFEHLRSILEEDYRVAIVASKGKVVVKAGFKGGSYKVSDKRHIKMNKDEDFRKYGLIVSMNHLSDFLRINGIEDSEIAIDPNSLAEYYSYNGKYSPKLTKSFISKWWGCDCPTLLKFSPNLDGSTNSFWDMTLFMYESTLVNATWSGVEVSKEITEEEAIAIIQDKTDTQIAGEISNVLNSRMVSEKEKAELTNWIESYEQKIQQIIDDNKDKIQEDLIKTYPDRVVSIEPFSLNDNFGLDCGDLLIFADDKDYTEKKGLLKNLVSCRTDYMNVHLPLHFQSVTVQRTMFETVENLIKDILGIRLYTQVQWD